MNSGSLLKRLETNSKSLFSNALFKFFSLSIILEIISIGETIFFSSFRDHEVRKVMKGEREVLVAWIYKKT